MSEIIKSKYYNTLEGVDVNGDWKIELSNKNTYPNSQVRQMRFETHAEDQSTFIDFKMSELHLLRDLIDSIINE